MTNSRAAKDGNYVLLDKHLATGTEATYTYTETLDMKTKYRELIVIINGKTTATLALQFKINGQTDYDYSQLLSDTTTVSTALAAASATITLIGTGLLDGANVFMSKIYITLNDASDTLMIHSESSAPHEGQMTVFAEPQTGTTTVTSIEILVSTSTWIAGTEISVYGILR